MPSQPEIMDYATKECDGGFNKEDLAKHFKIKPGIRTNGKRVWPGSINSPLASLVKHRDLLVINNGQHNVYTLNPDRITV